MPRQVTDSEASLVQNVAQLIAGLDGPEMASMRDDVDGVCANRGRE